MLTFNTIPPSSQVKPFIKERRQLTHSYDGYEGRLHLPPPPPPSAPKPISQPRPRSSSGGTVHGVGDGCLCNLLDPLLNITQHVTSPFACVRVCVLHFAQKEEEPVRMPLPNLVGVHVQHPLLPPPLPLPVLPSGLWYVDRSRPRP